MSWLRWTWPRLLRTPGALIGAVLCALLSVAVIAGPWITPHDPIQQNVAIRQRGPSSEHVFGTDHLGRDVFARLLVGARVALVTAAPAVLGALAIGLALGLLGGLLGGFVDDAVLALLDTVQAFPAVILALALLALIGPSQSTVMFVITLAFAPGYARVIRAQTQAARLLTYVDAARALGASRIHIARRHILPNIIGAALILVAMDIPGAITLEAGLSFLGLGIKPPTPAWGVILADGFARIRVAPWPVLFASATLMLATLGITLLAEAIRDHIDPRLRRDTGRTQP